MRPVLFTILGYPIRSYGFFIAVAVFAGILFAKWLNRRRRPQYVPLIEEFVTTALLGRNCRSEAVGGRFYLGPIP